MSRRKSGGNIDLYNPYAGYEDYWGGTYVGGGYGTYGAYGYNGYYASTGTYKTAGSAAKATSLQGVQDMDAVEEVALTPVDQMILKIAQQRNKMYNSYDEIMEDADRPDDCFYPTKQGYGFVRTRYIDGNKVMFSGVAKECPLFTEPVKAVGVYISNKIPKELFKEVLTSFYGVYKKYHKEASAQIWRYKDGDRKYFVVYPEQNISGASVSFKNDTEQMTQLREVADRIVDCHSHHSMGAFWSSIDDGDEQTADCFRMVIGCMSAQSAQYLLRVKFESIYRNFSATELFDMTEEEEAEILKTSNIEEDNGEIYKYILDSGRVANYVACGGGYRTVNSPTPEEENKRYEELFEELKTAPDRIYANSKYYKELWHYSKYVSASRKHLAFDYEFESQYLSGTPSCWVRVKAGESKEDVKASDNEVKNNDTPVAEAASEVISEVEETPDEPMKEEVTNRVDSYIKTLGKLFCGKETGHCSVSGTETSRLVDHLCGCSSDATYVRGGAENGGLILPGAAVEEDADAISAMLSESTSALESAVIDVQADARTQVQHNIEKSVEYFIGTYNEETPALFNESEFDFVSIVLGSATEKVANTFSPSIMWELFTPSEKSKLATAFGVSVADMGSAFGYASGCVFRNEEDRLSYYTVLVLYKVIAMSEEYFVQYYMDFFMSKEVQGDGNPAMLIVNLNKQINKLVEKDKQERN